MTAATILDQRRENLRLCESLKAAEERSFELAEQLERMEAERDAAVQMAACWTRDYSAGSAACIFLGGFAAAWAEMYCLLYPDPFKALLTASVTVAVTWVGWRIRKGGRRNEI